MKIKVLFFGPFKDSFKKDEHIADVTGNVTARALATDLLQKAGLVELESLPWRYALNEQFVDGDTPLHDQDELALIPPVSGG